MKKVLFWDFDGTLVRSTDYIWGNSLYSALTKLGYNNIEIEKINQHLSNKSSNQLVVFPWHTPEISYINTIGQKWWDMLFESFEPFYKYYKIRKEDIKKANTLIKSQIINFNNYTLYENAATVLRKCAEMDYKNYILSNNYPELPNIIKDLGLAEYFVDYAVSANIGYEKPRIEIFNYAMELAGSPDICYMIGDNPVADIQGGKSAGMKTILVRNNSNGNNNSDADADADYKCENLSEIHLFI